MTHDLTQRPPRSPRVKLGGYVILPRIIDKGRAAHAQTLGEYRFSGTGMDRHFYAFTGIDHQAFSEEIAKGASDSELLEWIGQNAPISRQPWEILAWSAYHEQRTADSDAETLAAFATSVGKFSTIREDIRTWFDLLDLDDYCTFGGRP